MSVLRGRSISEYCLEENAPGFKKCMFRADDEQAMLDQAPEDWDIKLLYKLCRYMCGLRPREDPVWETRADTLEYLISCIWLEARKLSEAAALTDQNLNQHLDRLQKYLGRVLDKVEERKQVDLGNVKREVWKEHRRKATGTCTAVSCYSDVPYMYTLLTQNIVHRIFVMAFKQLNCLKGKSVHTYLKEECKIIRPMLSFTHEEKRILKNLNIVRSEEMPVSLLYKLLQRVCCLRDHREWATSADTLEYSLFYIMQDHDNIALMDIHTYVIRSHQLYNNLEKILNCVSERSGKTKVEIIRKMPDEPMCSYESFPGSPDELQFPSCPFPSLQTTQQPVSSQIQQESLSALHSQRVNVFSTITPEDINASCLFKALCAGGIAARTMAKVYIALSGNINNVDPAVRKKLFTSAELSHMQGDVTHLDITLLYKGLRSACQLSPHSSLVWTTQGDTLEYYLYCVKNMRNKLVHEISSITNQELETKIQILESLLENILLKTSSKTQRDMQDEINIMKDTIQPLAHPPSIPLDKDSYYKSIKELREELTRQMVVDANKELFNLYRKASSINASPVTWCYDEKHKNITIGKLFSDLEIVNANDFRNESVFSLEDIISLQKNEEMGSRIIVIQGVAGAGKTSLCKYIVHLWSSDKMQANLEAIDLLIYIQCRYVTSASLSSFLMKILPDTFKNVVKEDVIPLMQEPGVLFLVDGYDEAVKEAKDLVKDILASLPESKMIITSKPQWVPKLKYEIHQTTSSCTVFSVTGFKEGQRDQYIRKFFSVMLEANPKQNTVCDKFLEYISELGEQLEALTQLPLTLALLALLWIEDHDNAVKAKTVTQLYRKLTDFMLKRLADQLNISDQHLCREWMLTLGEVAWVNLQKKQHHLSDRDITKLKRRGQELGVDGNTAISSLLRCDTQTSLTDSNDVWTFTHNCQQEFLAAEFIVDDIIMNKKSLSDVLGFKGENGDDKKLQRLIQMIEFIAGLLFYENEMEGRASEITRIISVQAPWSFMAVRRISRDLFKHNQEVFRNMFAGQEVASFLDEYNPECVKWVLENTSLGVPPHLRLRNPISDVLEMGPLLTRLVKRSCHPEVVIAIDHAISVSKAISFIESLGEPSVKFILLTWNSHSLCELVKKWPWPRSLHLSFPSEVFPLLWWELMMCLLGDARTPVALVHSSSDPRCAQLVKTGAHALRAACQVDDSLDAGTVVIKM